MRSETFPSIEGDVSVDDVNSRVEDLFNDAQELSSDAGSNFGAATLKTFFGSCFVALPFMTETKDGLIAWAIGGALVYWASRDIGDGIHKFKLAQQLRGEAGSLRDALSRRLIEAVNIR